MEETTRGQEFQEERIIGVILEAAFHLASVSLLLGIIGLAHRVVDNTE